MIDPQSGFAEMANPELNAVLQVLQSLQSMQATLNETVQRQGVLIEQQRQQGAEEIRVLREQAKAQADALVQSLKSKEKRPGVVDVKGVGKPEVLQGRPETIHKEWPSWSYKFSTWFGSQFSKVLKSSNGPETRKIQSLLKKSIYR